MANIDLLQHEIDRFGVVTVMDATIYDYETGAALLFLDTLKISNITAEGQQKEIKGGRYADLLLVYNYGRSVKLDFQDALLSPASMRQLWGARLDDTDVMAYGFETDLVGVAATDDMTVTLVGTHKATAVVQGVLNLTTGVPYAKADITNVAGVITIANAAADAGDKIRVDFQYPVQGAKELVLTSTSFPSTVKLVGKTFVLNQNTGKQVNFEIEVPKLKLAPNFTMTLEAEGDASVFDFSGMALINGPDKELLKLRTLD